MRAAAAGRAIPPRIARWPRRARPPPAARARTHPSSSSSSPKKRTRLLVLVQRGGDARRRSARGPPRACADGPRQHARVTPLLLLLLLQFATTPSSSTSRRGWRAGIQGCCRLQRNARFVTPRKRSSKAARGAGDEREAMRCARRCCLRSLSLFVARSCVCYNDGRPKLEGIRAQPFRWAISNRVHNQPRASGTFPACITTFIFEVALCNFERKYPHVNHS